MKINFSISYITICSYLVPKIVSTVTTATAINLIYILTKRFKRQLVDVLDHMAITDPGRGVHDDQRNLQEFVKV